MLSARQRGWCIEMPAGLGLVSAAMRDAVRVAMVVLMLGLVLAFGPELAGYAVAPRIAMGGDAASTLDESRASAVGVPAPAVQRASRLSDGKRQLAAWAQAGARASGNEQRNVARFLSERYRVASDEVARVVGFAYRTARETGLDPLLLLAVISVESNLDSDARSAKGAEGLMQVLTRVHQERFEPFGGPAAAFEPLPNIRVGAEILKEYLLREGSVEGALKSYVGAAQRAHDGGYGAKVLSERALIITAARGRPA